MGVYAPTLLLVVLSWLSFWINPDASAARIPLGESKHTSIPAWVSFLSIQVNHIDLKHTGHIHIIMQNSNHLGLILQALTGMM